MHKISMIDWVNSVFLAFFGFVFSITDSIKSPSMIDLAKNGSIGILTKNRPIEVIFSFESKHPIIFSVSIEVFMPSSSGLSM